MCEHCNEHIATYPNKGIGDIISNVLANLFAPRQNTIELRSVETLIEETAPLRGIFNQYAQSAVDTYLLTGDADFFYNDMRRALRNLYISESLVVTNSPRNLSAQTRRLVEQKLADQDQYLRHWRDQLRDLTPETVNPDAMLTRANMYANSSISAVEEIHYNAAGLPKLPFYPKDGQSECLSNCYCRWDIRKVTGGFDCAWIHDPKRENCPTCLKRSQIIMLSQPLKVRNGKIVNDYILKGVR